MILHLKFNKPAVAHFTMLGNGQTARKRGIIIKKLKDEMLTYTDETFSLHGNLS